MTTLPRPLTVYLSSAALVLACNARLAVIDEPRVGDAGAAGAAGHAGAAGSAGTEDIGAGEDAGSTGDRASCSDATQNGDETGVDCGGSCAACVGPCGCAESDALSPVGCEEASQLGTVTGTGLPVANATGDVIGIDLCFEGETCQPFVHRAATGARALDLPPGGGRIVGISADGTSLVLPNLTLGAEALVYDADGTPTATGLTATAAVLSENGSVVGSSAPRNDGSRDLVRWTRAGGAEVLAQLPATPNPDNFYFAGISADASAFSGNFNAGPGENHGFYFNAATGLSVDLGADLPPAYSNAQISGQSSDGSTLGGVLMSPNAWTSFRWTAAGGVVELGPAPDPGPRFAIPGVDPHRVQVNVDGAVITGNRADPANDITAFRWTEATGSLPLAPGSQSHTLLLGADGSVVIGRSFSEVEPYRLFFWTAATGARSIRAALETRGVDFSGWTLDAPSVLAGDGKVLVGVGTCGGVHTAYRLVLPD